MTVSKTFTPDLPGDYSGGGINIRTISIPEKPFSELSVSREINRDWTGKDGFVTYAGGGCSGWARDQGGRAMPPDVAGMMQNPDLKQEYSPASTRPFMTSGGRRSSAGSGLRAFDKATRSVAPAMGVKFMKVPDGNFGSPSALAIAWILAASGPPAGSPP